MLQKIKTFYNILTAAVETQDRLEKQMVILDRKYKLLEQKFDTLFEDAVSFMKKEQKLQEDNRNGK